MDTDNTPLTEAQIDDWLAGLGGNEHMNHQDDDRPHPDAR